MGGRVKAGPLAALRAGQGPAMTSAWLCYITNSATGAGRHAAISLADRKRTDHAGRRRDLRLATVRQGEFAQAEIEKY